MNDPSTRIEAYIKTLSPERQPAMRKLRETIVRNLPPGFEEVMTSTPSYVVPLSIFPDGYHCSPDTPLPFISLASQKNFIALHHLGLYANPKLKAWFIENYQNQVLTRIDMGKSCVRFKKMDQIPYGLVGQLATKITVKQWIAGYQSVLNR